MNCFSAERNLSAYIDDELPAEARVELENHLDACPSCRAEYESHLRAWETVGLLAPGAAPDDLWQEIEKRLGTAARAPGTEDLALMLRGLAGQVQDLQQSVDDLRRRLEETEQTAAEEREHIQVPSNPYRSVRPRQSSVERLRENPLRQFGRS